MPKIYNPLLALSRFTAEMGDGDDEEDADDGAVDKEGAGATSCKSCRGNPGLKCAEKLICYANVCLSLA